MLGYRRVASSTSALCKRFGHETAPGQFAVERRLMDPESLPALRLVVGNQIHNGRYWLLEAGSVSTPSSETLPLPVATLITPVTAPPPAAPAKAPEPPSKVHSP